MKTAKHAIALALIAAMTANASAADLYVDKNQPYNHYTWPAAHNMNADSNIVVWARNQWTNMYDLLRNKNIRAGEIDIGYHNGKIVYKHAAFRSGDFVTRSKNEIERFLKEDSDAVLLFVIEVNDGVTKADFKKAIDQLPYLKSRLFNIKDARWRNRNTWPTWQQLINSGQRVILATSNDQLRGDYGSYTILNRKQIFTENTWAQTDLDTCGWRFGQGEATFSDSSANPEIQWPRLFSMNHFGMTGDMVAAGNDNNWDGLYPRINTCKTASNTNLKPNFLMADYVNVGDVQEMAEVMTEGGIIFYEGNYASQNIVCGIGTKQYRKFSSGNYGCENDEARSAKLVNVQAGTVIKVYDSSSGSENDDFSIIKVKRFAKSVVIRSFEANANNSDYSLDFYRNNGLDGKISRFEIYPPGTFTTVPKLTFYEGNNGTQNVVCTVSAKYSAGINFKKDKLGCDNDEARSVVLRDIPKGTVFTVYDSPDGKTNDDYTRVEAKRFIPRATVGTFERSYQNSDVKVTFYRDNGLNGKVSRVNISAKPVFQNSVVEDTSAITTGDDEDELTSNINAAIVAPVKQSALVQWHHKGLLVDESAIKMTSDSIVLQLPNLASSHLPDIRVYDAEGNKIDEILVEWAPLGNNTEGTKIIVHIAKTHTVGRIEVHNNADEINALSMAAVVPHVKG